MSKPRPEEGHLRHSAPDPGGEVAASAARILAKAELAVDEARVEAEELRFELGAELSTDRATMAGLSRDLESVHAQLAQINSGIIGLQSHSLRQSGVAALALAVLIAIAWKVIGG